MKPLKIYEALLFSFGPQGWWPARTPFEVAVGAILTQQTSWKSVEKAIIGLRKRKLLPQKPLSLAPLAVVEQCIRPTGFYRQKAVRLRKLAHEFPRIQKLAQVLPLLALRAELLELDGVGKETADSILLYAFDFSILPIDAYTKRITARVYGFDSDYDSLRQFYESQLPKDPLVLNEFHALLVELAKRNCLKSKPECQTCPLSIGCRFGSSRLLSKKG